MPTHDYALVAPPWLPWETEYIHRPIPELSDNAKQQVQAAVHAEFDGKDIWLPTDWDWAWEVKQGGGPYIGNFSARLKVYLWKVHHIRAAKPVMLAISRIANVAQRQYPTIVPMRFRLTQQITWAAGRYGDYGSCFISDGFDGNILQSLIRGGGGALLRYTIAASGDFTPQGRCWVMPCKFGFLLCNFRDKQNGRSYGEVFGNALSAWLHLGPDLAFNRSVSNGTYQHYLYTDGDGNRVVSYNEACAEAARHAGAIHMHLPLNGGRRGSTDQWESAHNWTPPDPDDPWSEPEEEEE